MNEDIGYHSLVNLYNHQLAPNIFDKQSITQYLQRTMYQRTMKMFKYQNLPNTMRERTLKMYLQTCGYAVIIPFEGNDKYPEGFYTVCGGLGGLPDPDYMPTIATIANPALNIGRMFKIGEECWVIPNDSLYLGLQDIMSYNSQMLTEAITTLRISLINSRVTDFISAGDDNVYDSAEDFIEQMVEGKQGIIHDSRFDITNGLKISPSSATNSKTQISGTIEAIQFLRGSWFNDLCVQSNYNMKRESLNDSEISVNEGILMPLIDDMLDIQQKAFDEFNKANGMNIQVELDSVWAVNRKEREASMNALKVQGINPMLLNSDQSEQKGDDKEEDKSTDNPIKNSEPTNSDQTEQKVPEVDTNQDVDNAILADPAEGGVVNKLGEDYGEVQETEETKTED